MAVLRQRFLDAVVIVGDFKRAEVELANVRGFERIFAAALAALERLHESFVFFTHKSLAYSVGRRCCAARISFVQGRARGDVPYQGKQKAPTHGEKGLTKSVRCFSFSPDTRSRLELAPALKSKLQPVAVASLGQSLSHSA